MYYCAHAIFYFKVENQASFLIYENVYLVKADDEQAAMQNAISVALENEDLNEDGNLEVNGKSAQMLFAGIRKIIAVGNSSEGISGENLAGVELTYSVMEVDKLEEVKALAQGDAINILYRE